VRKLIVMLRSTALWMILLPVTFQVAGALSNQVVLFANHGTFPVQLNPKRQWKWDVDKNGMIDKEHVVMTSHTHLNLMADVFDFGGEGIESIGDLMIDLSDYLWGFAPFVWGYEVSRRLLKA